MNLWLRLLWVLISAPRRTTCSPLGPCRTPLVVLPTDLDAYAHMNNGRYLTLLDLGRIDLMLRSGMAPTLRNNRWYPVVTAETIAFHRALKLGDRFEIETSVLGWTHDNVFLQQRFLRDDEIVADAVVRALFLVQGGVRVPADELVGAVAGEAPPPVLPAWVAEWSLAQDALRRTAKGGPLRPV